LQRVAIEHEAASVAALGVKRDADFAALEAGGMKVVSLEGQARADYLAASRSKTLARMQTLMSESPMGAGNYDELVKLYYDASR
jgi:hypothetical protein